MMYLNYILFGLVISASSAFSGLPIEASIGNSQVLRVEVPSEKQGLPDVPFYSQFNDITSVKWQKIGCGIASLAMIINYYNPESISVDELLEEGISSGAYLEGAGWKHKDLVLIANKHGLFGRPYDYSNESMDSAFAKFEKSLEEGPVIVSVRYKLEPDNPIPHLAVINGIKDGVLHYNDPAEKSSKTISIENFFKTWKKRYIVIRDIK